MKGYFSRVAKQSGLRFSGRQGQQGLPRSSASPIDAAPPEHEEKIMVPQPSHLSQPRRSLPDEKAGTPDARSAEILRPDNTGVFRKSAAGASQRETVGTPPKDETAGISQKSPVEKERWIVTTPETPELGDEFTSSAKTEKEPAGQPGEFSVTEQTVLIDPEPIRSAETAPEEEAEPVKTRPAGVRGTEHKEYFSKTAEIIEKGEAEPTEVRKILFQEVQQWVADSPSSPSDYAGSEPAADENIAAVETAEASAIRETGQSRPRQAELMAVREKDETENTRTAGPAEQIFDLSIGTISVVIEEAEKPRRPETQQAAQNRNAAGETKREYSRLSRNYL